ncbi:MAG: type 4 prepilin-like proteins leader peptide-processing enzyme [Micavibrio sp.]|nr:MAG: type 4 prepilin-like proteins leader peptide-processing enzyme [Micavibrio sp.]
MELLIITAAALALGSFSTALIYRVPRNIPWAFGTSKKGEPTAGRSVCTSCKAVLSPLDLVPVFSWLFLRGKCRQCKTLIPARYPLTELGVVLACLGAYAVFGFNAYTFFIMAAIPFLMALLVIDLDHMILPNQLVFIVGLIGLGHLLFVFFSSSFTMDRFELVAMYVVAALFYAGLSWFLGWFLTKILKKDALGFGDVKFFAVAGLWLGLSNVAPFLILSGLLGIVFSVVWQKVKKEAVFPFGPALITSLYVVLLLRGSLLL